MNHFLDQNLFWVIMIPKEKEKKASNTFHNWDTGILHYKRVNLKKNPSFSFGVFGSTGSAGSVVLSLLSLDTGFAAIAVQSCFSPSWEVMSTAGNAPLCKGPPSPVRDANVSASGLVLARRAMQVAVTSLCSTFFALPQ